jgi:hypothetical protein
MGRARWWVAAGGAVALVLAGAALGAVVDRRAPDAGGCGATANPGTGTPRPDDVLLTEEPWDGAVSVHIGQRLVIVLGEPGFGGWLSPAVDGTAARLLATVGAYDYRCRQQPPP